MYRDIRGMEVFVYSFVYCVDLIYRVRKNLSSFVCIKILVQRAVARIYILISRVFVTRLCLNLNILSSNSIFALFGTSIEKYFTWK